MQAQPISRRLPATTFQHHALKTASLRPLGRVAFTQTSAHASASQQPPQSSPHDDPSNERDRYTSDGHRTYRKRLDNGISKRSLPLPPIMDPIALAARERWTEPKKPAPQRQTLTPFQRKLYANPYARALETPVRVDRTTSGLPSFFYLAVHPTPHPTTSEFWVLPLSLSAAGSPANNNPTTSPSPSPTAYVTLRHAHLARLSLPGKRDSEWKSAINTRVHTKVQAIAHSNNNNSSNSNSNGNGRPASDAEPSHMRQRGHRVPEQELVWREDMAAVVGDLLRRVAFRRLQYGFSRPRGGGVLGRIPGVGETEAASLPARLGAMASSSGGGDTIGAVLFLKALASPATRDVQQRVRQALHDGDALVDSLAKIRDTTRRSLNEKPLPRMVGGWDTGGPRLRVDVLYAGLEYGSVRFGVGGSTETETTAGEGQGREEEREVPVYDLVELLGEEKLRELVGGTAWEGEAAVVLWEKETTVGVHHALMQLQDYVIDTV
ncbi:esterase-like protein [Diplodia corticola]|uniref:Esterase-like protein n=1 Tax=Diplodia corticola TaxID=236234 RepID=A0A1J9RD08_9PEZI|nr:esterase-like protein [Diplodia corticola]OJD37994.1 esterase-like protein [Diplodia corticola]